MWSLSEKLISCGQAMFMWGVIRSIRLYRLLVSPFFPLTCRFYPSCSRYMECAVVKYGILKGVYLGIKRILKCHPWHPGGYDPVP